MLDQQRNILPAFPERGDLQRNHVEPVEQIFPELPVFHHLLQVPVGCRDHAGVGRNGLRSAEPLKRAVLQNPQQFDLDMQRDFPDLIKKDRSAFRQFEPPLAHLHRAGERAAFVAEEFALQQIFRQGRTVNRDKPAGPAAALMDRLGDKLLAGAALSGDQNGGPGRRNLFDGLDDVLHFRRVADHSLDSETGAESPFELGVLLLQPEGLQRAAEDDFQTVEVDRFCHEVEGAPLDRVDGGFDGAVGGEENAGRRRCLFQRGGQHVESAGARLHADVAEDQIVMVALDQVNAGLPVFGKGDVVFRTEKFPHRLPGSPFIVDNENGIAAVHAFFSPSPAAGRIPAYALAGGRMRTRFPERGKVTVKQVPFSSTLSTESRAPC